MKKTIVLALTLCAALPSLAVTTQTFTREGELFRVGTPEGMVVTPDGRLSPGPRANVVARPETGVVWSLSASGDFVLAGAGETSGLLRVDAQGTRPFTGIDKGPEVFAVARGAKGTVYAATGPDGAVYEIDAGKGTAREIWKPEATYVWALQPLPDGTLAVATGLPGKVFTLDAKGRATEIWSSADPHVRTLALGGDGSLIAGTVGSGQVVALDRKGGAFVLVDSDRSETVALAVDSSGTLWAAFAGARGSRPDAAGAAPARPPARGPSTSITVTPRAASRDLGPEDLEAAAQVAAQAAAQAADEDEDTTGAEPQQKKSAPAASTAGLPAGGGHLVRLGRGEEPEQVWSDDKETPMALLAQPGGGVLLGTASTAHIWWFDGQGRLGLFDERKDARAVSALAAADGRIWAATSNPASVVVYGPETTSPARWTSDVLDAKVRATIGRVHVSAAREHVPALSVFVRAGNSSEPGAGWTGWTEAPGAAAPPDGDGGAVALPLARYFQVRIDALGDRSAAVGVGRLALHYRPVNRAPKVDQVAMLPQGVALRALPPPQISSGEVPVVPPPRGPELEKALSEVSGTWRSKKAYEPGALTIDWDAKDPDGDDLRFDVAYCRDEGGPCARWIALGNDLDQTFFSFDGRTLPDGVYRFRVVASDAADNAVGDGRTGERVSDPYPVDNSPPLVDRAEYRAKGAGQIELTVAARDPGARLVKAEVSTEAGVYRPLAAVDGVGDATQETWTAVLDAPRPGQELLVRVVDAAGNATTRRAEPAAAGTTATKPAAR